MTRKMSALAPALALLVTFGAPGALAAPARDAAYTAVTPSDAGARRAIDLGLAELRGPTWLAAPKLAVAAIVRAERADGRYRVTALVKDGARQRPMRLEVTPGAPVGHRLTRAVIGPVGDEVLQADVPAANGLAGGWTERGAKDKDVLQEALVAADMLRRPEWVGRPVHWAGPLTAARSQVVAGTNLYVAGPATVAGFPHTLELVVYQPPSGSRSISWVALSTR